MDNREFIGWRLLGALFVIPEIFLIAQLLWSKPKVAWLAASILYPLAFFWCLNRWAGDDEIDK